MKASDINDIQNCIELEDAVARLDKFSDDAISTRDSVFRSNASLGGANEFDSPLTQLRALDSLRSCLDSVELAKAWIRVIGQLGDASCIHVLESVATKATNDSLRDTAVIAIRNIGGTLGSASLVGLYNDCTYEARIRQSAHYCLNELYSVERDEYLDIEDVVSCAEENEAKLLPVTIPLELQAQSLTYEFKYELHPLMYRSKYIGFTRCYVRDFSNVVADESGSAIQILEASCNVLEMANSSQEAKEVFQSSSDQYQNAAVYLAKRNSDAISKLIGRGKFDAGSESTVRHSELDAELSAFSNEVTKSAKIANEDMHDRFAAHCQSTLEFSQKIFQLRSVSHIDETCSIFQGLVNLLKTQFGNDKTMTIYREHIEARINQLRNLQSLYRNLVRKAS